MLIQLCLVNIVSLLLYVRYFFNSFFHHCCCHFFHCIFCVIERDIWMLLGTFRERILRSHLNAEHSNYDDSAINIFALPRPYYNNKKLLFPQFSFFFFFADSISFIFFSALLLQISFVMFSFSAFQKFSIL